MGNRAIITVEDEDKREHPVALYVHWNGGLESVEAFMQVAWEAPRNSNSLYDFHISLCTLLRNYWPDGLCLYGHPLDEVKASAGGCDNGHYRYRVYKTQPPKLVHWSEKPKGKSLNDCVQEARAHEYWTAADDIVSDLQSVTPHSKDT